MPFVAPENIDAPRVSIRLARTSDLPALLEVNADDSVTALLPYATWTSLDDAAAWLERMQGMQPAGSALQFVIVDKSTSSAIGSCLLFRYVEGSGRAELGYVLGRAHWGRGLMNEALTALLDAAFGPMGLRRIEAEIDVRNTRSAAVVERLGFRLEGRFRERWVAKGDAKDTAMYGLLRSDWSTTDR